MKKNRSFQLPDAPPPPDAGACDPPLGGECDLISQCGCPEGARCALRDGREVCGPAGGLPFRAPCDPATAICAAGLECRPTWVVDELE